MCKGLQQLSVKCQIPSASGIHKCLLYVVQREKKAKKVGEAAFTQEIRVFFEDKCQRRVRKLTKEVQKLAVKGSFAMQGSHSAYVKTLNKM